MTLAGTPQSRMITVKKEVNKMPRIIEKTLYQFVELSDDIRKTWAANMTVTVINA